jgi:hypothetical protein
MFSDWERCGKIAFVIIPPPAPVDLSRTKVNLAQERRAAKCAIFREFERILRWRKAVCPPRGYSAIEGDSLSEES